MSFYSDVREQDLIKLRKLAEQQKSRRAEKVENRILKQTHDIKLAESLSPITKKLDEFNKSTKTIGELVENSEVVDGNTQTPDIENTNISGSLLDNLDSMKTSKNFFKLTEDGRRIFWNYVFTNPLGDNSIRIKNQEYDISPEIHAYFTDTKLTTVFLDKFEKETVFDIFQNVGFMIIYPK